MYTIEQVNEAIQNTNANVVSLRRVFEGMFKKDDIYDYLIHEDGENILIYYSLTEDEDAPFFMKTIAKE